MDQQNHKRYLWRDLIPLIYKFGGASLALVIIAMGDADSCGRHVFNFYYGTAIVLLLDCIILLCFLFVAYKICSCISSTQAAYIGMSELVISFLAGLFYLGWTIYGIFVYVRENSCTNNEDFVDISTFTLVLFFSFYTALKLCWCSIAICTCIAALDQPMVNSIPSDDERDELVPYWRREK